MIDVEVRIVAQILDIASAVRDHIDGPLSASMEGQRLSELL